MDNATRTTATPASRTPRPTRVMLVAVASLAALVACTGSPGAPTSVEPPKPPAKLIFSHQADQADVSPGVPVTVEVVDGSLETVTLTSTLGEVPGAFSADFSYWRSAEDLDYGKTYTLSVTSPLAELKQSTVFETKGDTWRPLSGTDSSKVLTKRQTKNAVYDWGKGAASWSGDVKPERAGPIKLQSGDLDALLINLAIVRDLKAGKPLNYRMVEDGRVKQLSYTVAGKESITVGGKTHPATKVISDQGNKQTIAWIVDGMPVPARILQRDKGQDAIDLRVLTVR